jgi:DNA gyrase subunit A
MLVTDAGQLIRVPVDDIRIVGRNSQGVTVFSTKGKERVVSVAHIEGEDVEEGDETDVTNGEAETGGISEE